MTETESSRNWNREAFFPENLQRRIKMADIDQKQITVLIRVVGTEGCGLSWSSSNALELEAEFRFGDVKTRYERNVAG